MYDSFTIVVIVDDTCCESVVESINDSNLIADTLIKFKSYFRAVDFNIVQYLSTYSSQCDLKELSEKSKVAIEVIEKIIRLRDACKYRY